MKKTIILSCLLLLYPFYSNAKYLEEIHKVSFFYKAYKSKNITDNVFAESFVYGYLAGNAETSASLLKEEMDEDMFICLYSLSPKLIIEGIIRDVEDGITSTNDYIGEAIMKRAIKFCNNQKTKK